MTTAKQNMINRIAIYDMDGTIVCSLHRYRTIIGDNGERIDLDYWRENEYRAMDDSLLPLATNYKQDIADRNCFVVIATARILRSPDLAFIADKLGNPDFIVSRPENETISGGTLKIRGLQKVFEMFPNIKRDNCVFYEDNVQYLKAVCDYYNIRGVYVPSKQGH
jgi:hypothetical protein